MPCAIRLILPLCHPRNAGLLQTIPAGASNFLIFGKISLGLSLGPLGPVDYLL
jgi:hypothetical protein